MPDGSLYIDAEDEQPFIMIKTEMDCTNCGNAVYEAIIYYQTWDCWWYCNECDEWSVINLDDETEI